MTKIRSVVCAGSLLAIIIAGPAKGAIEAVSFLHTTDFGLFVDTGGGTPGAMITNGVHLTVTSALFTSEASANILSIPGGPVATSAGSPFAAGLDTPIAQEGSAVANNSLFPPPFGAGPAPFGTNLGAPLPHAVGDTAGSGALIAGLPDGMGGVIPFGGNLNKTAQADLSLGGAPGGFDIGSSDATDTSTGSFLISVVGGPLSIVGIFDASISLLSDLTPSPPGSSSAANGSFRISVTDLAGTPIFSWAPNGMPGGIVGGTEFSDPFSLNTSVSAAPGGTSSFAMTTLGGGAPPAFSAGFTLMPGTYSFNVSEEVQASVSSVGQIPEPSTIFVWALLALGSGGAACYVRRNNC